MIAERTTEERIAALEAQMSAASTVLGVDLAATAAAIAEKKAAPEHIVEAEKLISTLIELAKECREVGWSHAEVVKRVDQGLGQ